MGEGILAKIKRVATADLCHATQGSAVPKTDGLQTKVEQTLNATQPALHEAVPVSGGPRSVLGHDLGFAVIAAKKNEQNATAAPSDAWSATAPAGMGLRRFRVDVDATYTYAACTNVDVLNIIGTMSLVVDGVNAFYGTGYIGSGWVTKGAILAQGMVSHRANSPGSSQGGQMYNDPALATTVVTSGFAEFFLPVTAKSGMYTVNIQFNSAAALTTVAATTGSANVGVSFVFMATGQRAGDIPFTLAVKATNNASTLTGSGIVAYGLACVNNDLGSTGGVVGIVTAYTFGSIGYGPAHIALREDGVAPMLGTAARSAVAYHGAPLPTDPATANPLFAILDTQPTPKPVNVSLSAQFAVVQIAYGQTDAASLLSIQSPG